MTDNTTKLQTAISILQNAKIEVAELLADSPQQMLIIRTNNSLDLLVRLFAHHCAGSAGLQMQTVEDFPPLTTFMGEELKNPKQLTAADVTVDDEEKNTFKGKVKTLYEAFETMDNDTILKSYINETDVIRGVAKKAGVATFKESELNYIFMDEIREAMKTKAELADKQQAATEESELNDQLTVANTKVETLSEKLTQAKIEHANAVEAKKPKNQVEAADKKVQGIQKQYDLAVEAVEEITEKLKAFTAE